ncbi:MAG TPA: hypothetical protein VGO27_22840 [Candidatus Acidoferrum sp.]|jgi:hypothetical protein|nr:hypothetical protein [Candidatus Acidoferrum sp.]
MHIAQRVTKMPNLVLISEQYTMTEPTPILPRCNYVEVIARTAKRGSASRPEQRLCNYLVPAIHADGMDKGRLVKVCATRSCPIHFRERQREEKQRLQWKAEKTASNRKAKQTLSFRHRLLAEVLKRVKQPIGAEELRLVTRFVLRSLPHELACRLAKRRGLHNAKNARDWELPEKARALYKKASAVELAALLFEAILIGSAGGSTADKNDDPLVDAAAVYKIRVNALRATVAKDEKAKLQKKGAKLKGEPTRK